MSKEESVEVVPRAIRKLPTTDHTGRQFGTILDMVRYWGISYGIFYDRYAKRGWTLEETLTTPVISNISGYSDREFLTKIGMSYTTFYKLKNKGYTKEDMQECLSQGIRPTDLVFKVNGVWYASLTDFLRKFGYASTREGIAPKIKSGIVKLEDIVEAHEQGIHLTSLSVKAGGKWYTSLSAMISSFGCNPASCSYFKKKFSGNVDWIYDHLVELQERRQKKEGVSLA